MQDPCQQVFVYARKKELTTQNISAALVILCRDL